jgi:hypothetical protein
MRSLSTIHFVYYQTSILIGNHRRSLVPNLGRDDLEWSKWNPLGSPFDLLFLDFSKHLHPPLSRRTDLMVVVETISVQNKTGAFSRS